MEELRRGVEALGWSIPAEPSAILPLIVGGEAKALAMMGQLRERNEARLRVTVSASHSSDDLQALLEALARYEI